MEWKLFGWQGFVCPAPRDWELATQQGSFHKGYLRLNDSAMPRMEVKWERKRRPPSLEAMERAYRSGLRKAKGLEAIPIHEKAVGTSPTGSWQRFRWQGKTIFDDALLSCRDTRRAVVLRIYSPSRQKGEELMRRVLAGFHDFIASNHTIWTAYGFACEVPAGFQLRKADLRAGFILLRFQRARDQLEFQRLRLGTVPETGKDLDSWADRVLGKRKHEEDSSPYAAHECKQFALAGTQVIPRLRRPVHKPMDHAWLWRCHQTDSLYLVKTSWPSPGLKHDWRVWCHETPDPETIGRGA